MSQKESTGEQVYSGIAEFGKIRAGIGLAIAGIIGVIMFIVGVYLLLKKETYSKSVKGKIIESICSQVSTQNQTASFKCDIKIEYIVDGTTHTTPVMTETSSIKYEVGSIIDVYYNPENVKDVSLSGQVKKMGWILIGISIVLIAFAAINFYLTTKYKGYAAFTGATGVASAFGSGRGSGGVFGIPSVNF